MTASVARAPRTADPRRTPTTADPRRTPTTADPGQTPTTADPGQTPTTADPGQTPATADPGQTPTTADPGQEAAAASEVAEHEAVPLLAPRDGLPPLVVTAEALDTAARLLGAGSGPVAVDAERASGFRYGHRAFLVQLRRQGAGTMLIDPVSCPDLSGVDDALAAAEAVLHAASQDLPCLADLGFRPRRLFDTELAGRLLGYPRVGLGTLVEEVLGLTLEKSHSAADWSTRPLPAEWLRYAALDVEVLVELRDALAAQLTEQGKTGWAEQEFAAILAAKPAPPRPDAWRRTSGIHRVRSRRGLAIVRELWLERDQIAQRRDISPTRVLTDAAIVEAARAAPSSLAELGKLPGFTGRGARRYGPDWLRAVRRAKALADSGHLPTENLVAPDAVRRLAWQPPEPLTPESVAARLERYGARQWQIEITALPIAMAIIRLIEKGEA